MAADSGDIDQAIIAALQADATLMAMLQSGASVFKDEAPINSKAFVIVSLLDEADIEVFEGRALEESLYLVEMRELSTVPTKHAKAAAARIDVILKRATLSAPGYAEITTSREARVTTTEIDDVDSSIRWNRHGGHYRAVATPA